MLILILLYWTERIFRQDGDAALPFEIHGIHDPFGDLLVFPEGAALTKHAVQERGLSMVDVGDDG